MRETGQRRRVRAAVAALGIAVVVVAASPAGAQTDTTVPVDPAATTVPVSTAPPTTNGVTTTTVRPAVCDDVAPTVAQFLGTVTATGPDSVQYRVDEVRSGSSAATSVQVLYVRDARFLKDGHQYLVTASLDTETKFLVSKVRTKRGEDPRCTVKDPIYTREPDGSPIDTGVFAGMKGHSRDVIMAFLKPLGAVLAVLLGLVIVKYVFYFAGKGIKRLVSRPAR